MSRDPLAMPTISAAARPLLRSGQDGPNGVANPQAPPILHQPATATGSWRCGCNEAPAGPTRSRAMSQSTSSALLSTATEAMARARLLLKFPPAAERMDEWRATIQSLIDFAETGGQQVGPS
jgi:hypothetical protein